MHKQTTRNKSGRGLIRNDIEKLKAILAITARDVRGQAKEALSESYENVKDRTTDLYGNIKDKTTDLQENVAEYVGAKPYKAMAIASFLGLAFGLAMRRKRHVRSRR